MDGRQEQWLEQELAAALQALLSWAHDDLQAQRKQQHPVMRWVA
ncbi:hypothetical protein [Umezawaea sp. NPDC059074]